MSVGALERRNSSPGGHSAPERARAARILTRHGVDSLDPFALRDDKAFHFAAGGLLAHRVVGRTAIVAGDPVGPAGSAGAILESFEAAAERRGLSVVLHGASSAGLAAARERGFRTMRVGDEAVVDPGAFSLEGRAVRKVRQSVTRVERLGWAVEVAEAEALDPFARAELDAVEGAWCARQPRLQGFAMTLGRLWGVEDDPGTIFAIARDPDGSVRAFQRYAAYRGGLSLDVMRREEDTPNGLNEALVVAVLAEAKARELREVSLNFAGFSHLMRADPATLSPRRRVLRRLLELTHGRFQLERLAAFNAKFFPVWRPRHLAYRHALTLPLAGLRVLQAEGYVAGAGGGGEPAPARAPDRGVLRPAPVRRALAPAADAAAPRAGDGVAGVAA